MRTRYPDVFFRSWVVYKSGYVVFFYMQKTILNILNEHLPAGNGGKIYSFISTCSIAPINIKRGYIHSIDSIDTSSGEILFYVFDLDKQKLILLGSNHPKLWIEPQNRQI